MHRWKSRCLPTIFILAVLAGAARAPADKPAENFAVALLPDTQNYAQAFPDTYLAQTGWIKQRAGADNIKFVIHLGDIVQEAAVEKEWQVADRAHRLLDGVVPYSVLPGNHDMSKQGDTPLYNKYFPPARFKDSAWYGGHFGDKNDNNYCLFDAAGMKFMVVSLRYSPPDEVLNWANQVVRDHPDRRVIVATHSYMNRGSRNGDGQIIWNKFVRKHENIFMVVSGHVLGFAHQVSLNDAGGRVHEILSDYQGRPNGGDGWMQTLYFLPAENKIRVVAYSPVLKKHDNGPQHTYTLKYEMGAGKLKKAG